MIELGGKWLIPILQAMPRKGSRFTPLQSQLSISPSRLSDNLNKLIALGYIKHLSPIERRHPLLPEYVLTNKGLDVKNKIDRIDAFDKLLNQKWCIPIIVAIDEGYTQFNDLKKYLKITPKVLSKKLVYLEENSYITKLIISMHPVQIKYQITSSYIRFLDEIKE